MLAVLEPQHTLHDVEVAGEHVVVGRYYLVPCVNGIPVIGDPHEDHDHFNYTRRHYHCDSRFHNREVDAANCAVGADAWSATEPIPQYPDMQVRLCIRDTPAPWQEGSMGMVLASLYADFGFTKSACGRCPHKGMPIINGVCSGHRLKWNKDGTIAHKPPYTLRILGSLGSHNSLVINERVDAELLVIPITEKFSGHCAVEMKDSEGNRISEIVRFGFMHLRPGDELKIGHSTPTFHYD